ncbi:hypothetical protein K2173_004518 [Erythroxylum novogranatense]|uniref:MYB transcription factor n=1 Tax=Erythroxylum novogranatense TaxID=1862640 RepID=A0AAV8TL66_9ROSI|nr:hypothetical protein K2173_004518 [Erythroxylum novogranatense]
MGNPKQKWTAEEEEALRAGVAKHGAGKWKNIQKDPEFNPFLFSRTNIDLKDKWRNMSISAGEKSRPSKPKLIADASAPAPSPPVNTASDAVAAPVTLDLVVAAANDSSKTVTDAKLAPRYNAMIFEAISVLNQPNGSDPNAIANYIEQRQELPQTFKKQLSSRLRRLVSQEKLEKVQNCYRIKKTSSFATKTPSPKRKELQSRQLDITGFSKSEDTFEEAAAAAAYRVADAENKSFVAAEAVKEAERVSRIAEEADSLVEVAKEIIERCSRGEVVLMV